MNKIFKYAAMFCAVTVMSAGFTSCSDDDNNEVNATQTAQEAALKVAESQYTNNVVIETYKGLADACESLQGIIESMSTDANVESACAQWKKARKFWEFSEAFLYGAASGYGIDPHIDTWPFDETVFNNHIASFNPDDEASVAKMEEVVATGQNLTGFHALEYLIFRDGAARKIADISAKEMAYAKLVAADLYLSSVRLQAAWAGIDNISSDRQALLEDAEMEPDANFGEYMINAGEAGSIYRTRLAAALQIIDGCKDIADEVAHSKIGKPNTGEDRTYIESPNAYNSIIDFYDNIMSCKHALYGTMGNTAVDFDSSLTAPATNSVLAYAQIYHPSQAQDVITKLDAALNAVKNMKAPFVLYYTDSSAKAASDAISEFDESLSELEEVMSK